MAVPSVMADLSTTANSNSPAGTESPSNADDFLRAIQAIVRTTNAKGADIASATTTDIGAATGEFVDVTGTTTITGLGTVAAGIVRTVRFTGALTLTHNATSLILPGGENITTAANDRAIFRSLGSGNWLCVAYVKANGTPVVTPTVGTANVSDEAITNAKLAFDGGSFGTRNRLINPSGAIYQIAVAATADDAYFADGWYMLTQTNTVTPSKLSDPEDGFLTGIRITQSQAVAQRFGFAQIIESVNCKDMRGGSVVMVPRIRISNSQAVRYAILGWTGTADAVTSDVVADWTSSSYTAGGFFNSTTLSVIAVGSQTPSAATWTSLTALTAAAGSTFNNIIVMVWTEGTAAQNVTLDFDYVQLEKGSDFTAFEFRDFDKELRLCERYFEKSYDLSVSPGAVSLLGAESSIANANATTALRAQHGIRFKTRKRAAPNITLYSPDNGTSGNVYDQLGTADRASNANIIGETGFTINPTTISADARWRAHWIADARL